MLDLYKDLINLKGYLINDCQHIIFPKEYLKTSLVSTHYIPN